LPVFIGTSGTVSCSPASDRNLSGACRPIFAFHSAYRQAILNGGMRLRSSPAKWSAAGKFSGLNRVAEVAANPAVLAPLLIGGVALVLTRAGLIQKLFQNDEDCLLRAERLCRAIVGNDKHAVSSVLGRPQASVGSASAEAVFLANRWYYRLDSRNQIAITIEFENDVAREVEILHIHAGHVPERATIRHGVSA
jgi:hypothetical protein